jgi:hypothetical protein
MDNICKWSAFHKQFPNERKASYLIPDNVAQLLLCFLP